MPRIYAPVEDLILKEIDEDAKEKSISRSQWVNTAINAFLHLDEVDMDQVHRELDQIRNERDQIWRESVQLKKEKDQSYTEVVQLRDEVKRLSEDLVQARMKVSALSDMVALAKSEADKIKEAVNIKEEEIVFLRGHVSQLTQSISQLSLPPAQGEARRKGWWQFWR